MHAQSHETACLRNKAKEENEKFSTQTNFDLTFNKWIIDKCF